MGKNILLEDLKAILNNGVIIQTWIDEEEDFKSLYQTDVFKHNNADISDELWQSEVVGINACHECGIDYTVVEIG